MTIMLIGLIGCSALHAADVYGHAKVQKATVGGKRCPATQTLEHIEEGVACSAASCQTASTTAENLLQQRLNGNAGTAHCTAIALRKCECKKNGDGPKNVTW
jgi:hypothetical protein